MPRAPEHRSLQGCHVLSLRPTGGHDSLRRAALREGARVLALSPWRIEPRHDAEAVRALRCALRASHVVFTSPQAVRSAAALQPLRMRRGQIWFAVGEGTARALRRAGIGTVHAPVRMDSEGLLALPGLERVRGADIGLVTAPGGRDRIAAELRRRGARILRADVYTRVPITPATTAVAKLQALRGCLWLALSSGEALHRTFDSLPSPALRVLRRARVAAASPRLAELARQAGFGRIAIAASTRPRDLVAAMAAASR
jgi:uroporphyrinogen-III synthase